MELNKLRKYGIKIETYLKLNTFTLAIKLLKNKKEIPSDAKRPKKDFDIIYPYVRPLQFPEGKERHSPC